MLTGEREETLGLDLGTTKGEGVRCADELCTMRLREREGKDES